MRAATTIAIQQQHITYNNHINTATTTMSSASLNMQCVCEGGTRETREAATEAEREEGVCDHRCLDLTSSANSYQRRCQQLSTEILTIRSMLPCKMRVGTNEMQDERSSYSVIDHDVRREMGDLIPCSVIGSH